MDANRKMSNWRRIQERCLALDDLEEKKLILQDALIAIEAEQGKCSAQLIYPYEKLIEVHHELGEKDRVVLLLPRYYLVLEMSSVDEPERLLTAVEKIRDQGYLCEAMSAGCRLLYLLYESHGVRKQLVDDAWYLLSEMHKQRPDVNAKKLLKYLGN